MASAGTLSYQMQFATEHRLARTVSPVGAGTVSASDGYYSAGIGRATHCVGECRLPIQRLVR